MAFDFRGSTRPSTPSSNNARKDISYTSDSAPRVSSRDSSEFGHFGDLSGGFDSQGIGFRDAPRETFSKQTGFQNRPSSGGFFNGSDRNRFDGSISLSPARNTPTRTAPPPAKHPATQRRGSSGLPYIPLRIVLSIMGIIVLVILCIVFRDAITKFLVQVLAWIIIVLIILLLIKWLIFGGRRRW